jgi:hypothetical protein
MTNLNASAKSRGVVLFAFNTDTVDYELIAKRASKLITHTLNLPVTLITDVGELPTNFRQVYAGGTVWYNSGRYLAYKLSPYDETLLLDSDYLILDDSLLKILDAVVDYTIMTKNQNPTQSMTGNMGILSLNYVWATAIAFKKTTKSKLLFELVGRIQRNYDYYIKLYNLREHNFRNDYAFTIADNILNGYTNSSGIPWTMLTIANPITKIEIKNNKLIVREQESAHILSRQNIHIIDKDYLLSDDYQQFVDTICQS